MFWNFFRAVSQSCLGIDIGTSSVRIVELSSWRKRKRLENYGELLSEAFPGKALKTISRSGCVLSNQDIAEIITAVLKEAKIKTRKAVLAVPDFCSFFTWFELPSMTKEELPQAVRYEARQHIPFPLSEVTIDWQLIEGVPGKKEKGNLKVLLVSVLNEVIEQYREVASLARLELLALEAEVFALSRALINPDTFNFQTREGEGGAVAIIDIGAQSTTVSIIDRGILKRSHSFDIAGNQLTDILAKGLNLDYGTAEELKQKYGLQSGVQEGRRPQGDTFQPEDVRRALLPLIDLILSEIEKICQDFYQTENRDIQRIITAGGAGLMPGLKDYFSEQLKKKAETANPFSDIFYPPILEDTLKRIGPLYAVAVGASLRGIE